MPTIQKTKRMFAYIKGSILVNGEAPTLREIGEEFNMSSSASVFDHLKKMEERGWITRTRSKMRGIQVVEQSNE